MKDKKPQEDAVLSTKLAQADRRIHIESLKREAARLNGGEMLCGDNGNEADSAIIETFWEKVVAFEKAPCRTLFAQLQEAGVALPTPDSLDDAQLHEKLWQVIRKLGELGAYLSRTDHLSDRGLYALLWDEILREEETVLPDEIRMDCVVDLLGGFSEEDVQIGLRYYDDEFVRDCWAAEYPEMTLPPSEELPFSRDQELPKSDLNIY